MSPKRYASPATEHQEKIAHLPFVENRAVGETAQTLRDELLYHRATQTYLWAMPLINTLGMQRGSEKAFGAGYDILPIWNKRLDAFPLLPPGYKGEVPEDCFVCRSGTNNVFVFLRAFYADASELKPPVELIAKTKIYPLKGEARPMRFPEASGVPANMLPPGDLTAFELLKKLVDSEGPHLADPDWTGMLAGLGIVKGEPFDPDERTRGILDRAAKSAYKMSRVIGFDEVVSGRSFRMYPDRGWVNPMADASAETPSGKLDLSWRRRPWFFTNDYSLSPGMLSQIPGKGAFYVMAFTDSAGAPLSGGTNYRLNLPKDVPATNFWSMTLYDAENSSGLANGRPFPSLGSRDNPVQNADGSTDLYLGPKAPEGKERNWLATVPGKGYFAILRLYGPTEPALTKIWKPGDVVSVR